MALGAAPATNTGNERAARTGAYGLALSAVGHDADILSRAAAWLLPADPSWPRWELRSAPLSTATPGTGNGLDGEEEPVREHLGPDRAVLRSEPAGRIEIDRVNRRTTFFRPEPMSPEGLVHPYLASTAAIASHWLGRTPFHAGAFVLDGRAWGVLGTREMGKSSLLLGLHMRGVPVVTDDVVVVDGPRVYSGPRCLDLREPAAEHFRTGQPLGKVGRRERWRVDLPEIASDFPLAGWVLLGWSDHVAIEPIEGSRRLAPLASNRALVAPGTAPRALLDMATLPVVLFGRPKGWGSLAMGLELLLRALAKC